MGAAIPSAIQGSHTVFDAKRWPLVVVRPLSDPCGGPGPYEGPAFAELSAQVVACFERGEDFAFVVDLRDSTPMTAADRRAMAELLDHCTSKHPNVHSYNAIVIESAVQRGIVKAVTWLRRQPHPTEVFASLDDAMVWCSSMLEKGKTERRRPAR